MKKRFFYIFFVILALGLFSFSQDLRRTIRAGNLDELKAILKESPDLIKNPKYGDSLLMSAVKFKQPEIVKFLLNKGADPDFETITSHFTPIIWAIRHNNLDMIKLLLDGGANIHHKTFFGESYLHFAALLNRVEIADFLIKKGIDVNIIKPGNLTPLHIASVFGNKEIVVFLISKKADLNLRATDGSTPLHFAQAARRDEVVKILKTNGAKELKRNFTEYKGPYFGQTAPGNQPKLFVPELFSNIYRIHGNIAFSPEGDELFFECAFMAGNYDIRIWHTKIVDGKWSAPQVASFSDFMSGGPFFSPDGKKVVYHSRRPTSDNPQKRDIDLWYAEKTDGKWSEAKHLGNLVNSDKEFEAYPFFGNDYTIYFYSRDPGNIFKSKSIHGVFQKPEPVGDLFNSEYVDDCKEMKYFLIGSDKRVGNYFHELYVSFHLDNGKWSPAKYMGELVKGHRARAPRITHDKKYIFFNTSAGLYWVNTTILENVK